MPIMEIANTKLGQHSVGEWENGAKKKNSLANKNGHFKI